METLLYFAFWAGLIFLMMRLGCGAHVMGRSRDDEQTQNERGQVGSPELRWVPPKTDTDPVCNKTVSTIDAKPSVHAGNVYYFCSRECREVFEAAPDLYVGGADSNRPEMEHSHA